MDLRPLRIAASLPLLLAALPAAAQEDDVGELLFRQRCAACHSVEPGQNRAGPHLDGILGRQAGTVEGVRYSAAMRVFDARWDDALLDRFLADPRAVVPGTSMMTGVPNAEQRRAIIAYLGSRPD